MKCKKCGRPMRWKPYTTARRTDELRGRFERAPIDWAWFCRCGMWTYPEEEEELRAALSRR